MGICFVDTETTGLDPERHAIWEVALIDAIGEEHVWMVRLTDEELKQADPYALQISGFHKRHPQGFLTKLHASAEEAMRAGWALNQRDAAYAKNVVAERVARLTWGHHLVGTIPSFDEERLRKMCDQEGIPHNWHYHVIDVEALAVGFLAGRNEDLPDLPWGSDALMAQIGVPGPHYRQHEALEDARWARDAFYAVTGDRYRP